MPKGWGPLNLSRRADVSQHQMAEFVRVGLRFAVVSMPLGIRAWIACDGAFRC